MFHPKQLYTRGARPVVPMAAAVLFLLGCSCPCLLAQTRATPPAKEQHIETEIVTIARGVASPSEINRSPGAFLLKIEDRTANPAWAVSGLELRDATGNVVGGIIDSVGFQRHRSSSILVHLPPGDYQVRVEQSARALCEIHIH
jgi:hypothetical protein